ncbi:MAG: alpha/beta fold hydrolase, partial [Planctomycetota bacterium]
MNDHESNPGPAVSSQQESDTESKQRVPGGSGWDSIGWYEWWRRRVVNVCLILMIVYIGLLVALVFAEPMLVYPAPKLDAARRQTLRDQGPAAFQPVQFQSRDGIELHGHYLPFEGSDRYILMCHGNGEDRDTGIWHAEEMRQRCRSNVLLFDFRGYGESGGKPNQAGILQDGEAAMDWLVDEKQISPDRVIVYGRSLGGA